MTGIAGAEANAPAIVLTAPCFACGREMREGIPYAVKALPGYGMVGVGSKTCMDSPRYKHGFLAEVWLT